MTSPAAQQETPAPRPVRRRINADLALGLGLLGLVIVAKLAWVLSDGSALASVGLG